MSTRKTISVLWLLVGSLAGCVGSPIHETVKYNKIQSAIKANNQKLMNLQVGMAQQDVHASLGDPERSEGYEWGSAWLYRTAMTSGVYGTADSDFTPVVFDSSHKLIGWGRNFFTEQVKRYDVQLHKE